jgi:hydroxypyruvate reductase
MNPRTLLLDSFNAALAAADPLRVVPPHLASVSSRALAVKQHEDCIRGDIKDRIEGRALVVGAGKAAAAMAQAVETHWPQEVPLSGIVLTRYGHGLPLKRIQLIEAGHPLPDESGEQGARAILAEIEKLRAGDFLLCLLSGGGSSLLAVPVTGISLDDLRDVTTQLLNSGATIQEINTVRKHLSATAGGRLAASSRAPVLALIISDVTGDDPTHIASGPCAPDPTTFSDAVAILRHYKINASAAVTERLRAGVEGRIGETPKPGDAIFDQVENRVIATAHASLAAAAEYFRAQGIPAVVLGDSVTGEAREVAKVFAAMAKEVRQHGQPWKLPIALISGGETTVTLRENEQGYKRSGRGGGRNTEFLLSLAIELNGAANIYALACDTDGIDGTENNAGALITPDSLRRAAERRMNPSSLLTCNNAYAFFEALGDLVMTGPTRTNVNDYRVILIL